MDPEDAEQVYEGNVSVSPGESKSLEVLGDAQFRVTVSGLNQEMSFLTRPICEGAKTTIIIDENGELQNEVWDCE